MASWSRVAAGLQLVAEQAAKLTTSQASHVAQRTAQHGYDAVATSIAAAASHPASILFHHLQRNEPSTSGGSASSSSSSSSSSSWDNDIAGTDLPPAVSHPAGDSSTSDTPPQPSGTSPPVGDLTIRELPTTDSPPPTRTGVLPVHAEESIHSTNNPSQDQPASDSITDRRSRIRDPIEPPLLASQSSVRIPASVAEDSREPIQAPLNPPVPLVPPSPDASPWNGVDGFDGFDCDGSGSSRLKEGRPVPSTRIGRAAGFAQLGVGLALGAAVEGVSRLLQMPQHESIAGPMASSSSSPSTSILVNDANSDRLAESLCRMRGAALKMGQMLSIQDETLMPPALQRALVRVRQGAEAMPKSQLERQMVAQLGPNWRERFVAFEDLPFAAASIGQVHRAVIRRPNSNNNHQLQNVVVKVQYPGVAKSIRSDLRNLSMLVTWTGMAPPGLFIDNVIRVGEQELTVECDYKRELINQGRIKALVESDPVLRENRFVVPDVVPDLSTDQILTSEFRPGGTIDKVTNLSQEERNRIGRTIMYLTMKELFVWRFMQTDPNWGNFLYDMGTRTTSLIDFGAAREYSKSFVDGYLRIVWASANRDDDALMEQSYRMKFLTGDENDQMLRAHKLSGYTVGEPFYSDEPFDFRGSNISTRMGEHTSVFLRHRLTPPPEEVYTLHRKLAGAYMLCIKLGAVIECRSLLHDIVANHKFEDGLEPLVA